MGLQGNVADLSSDSIPLLLLALTATCVRHLRSLLLSLLRPFSLLTPPTRDDILDGDGAAAVLLAEQLRVERAFSFRPGGDCGGASLCVFCMCGLREGDQARVLACRHVFHKDCFDGWLDRLNFTCPLCRSPLVAAEERGAAARRRVGEDAVRLVPIW